MTTPSTPTPAAPPPPPQWRRPRRRGFVIGAAVVATLIVGGVAAALLIPHGGPWRGGDGPAVGLVDESGELGLPEDGGGRGDGPGRGRGGPFDRGLGDDTLIAGTVVSAGNGTLVVTPDGGAQRTIRTDDTTRVRGDGNAALGDVAPGERVVVRVSGTGDAATAVAVLTPRARVAGTVTALSGDTATITAFDGLTVTANVAGLSQKPAVGDLVVVAGVTADGTTITADRIRVLPKAS